METWIQFALLMAAIIAAAMRNEHRITLCEQGLKEERKVTQYLEKRLDRIEAKL